MKTLVRAREDIDGIWLKTDKGIEKLRFKNYFYIKHKDYDKKKLLKFNNFISEFVFEGEYVKIVLSDNTKRNLIKYELDRAGIKHYEADIMTPKRWLLDNLDIPINASNLTWVMYDIETRDDGPFDKDRNGTIIAKMPILSIAYIDHTGKKYWLKNKNKEDPELGEKELLETHNEIIKSFDCILAWNGYRFDDSYCKQRNEFHNFSNFHYDFINQLDYMEMVKKNYGGLESYSLDVVAKTVVKDAKIEIGEKGKGAIYNAWLASFNGDNLLEKYNMMDVELMYQIEKKLNFIGLHMKEADMAHCFIQETLHNSDICDFMLLPRFKRAGINSPSKPNPEEIEERKKKSILGAYTFCKNPGVHDDVQVFDFKSQYTAAMASNNICVTTKIYHDQLHLYENYVTIPENSLERGGVMEKADTKYYDNDKKGIISQLAFDLIEERDKVKYEKFKYIKTDRDKYKEMELYEKAIKTVGNSLYGALSFIYFRYYDYDVADSITQFCRGVVQDCISVAEELGFNVIQGDTDSIMINKGTSKISFNELEHEFFRLFNAIAVSNNIKSMKFKIKDPKTGILVGSPHFIVLEHEKTFEKMISIKKKNYAALMEILDGDGKPTGQKETNITGLECKKKDTNPLAKKIQKDLIEAILNNCFDEKTFLDFMLYLKEDMKNNQIETKYLVMKKSLNKSPNEYGGQPIDSKTGKPKVKKDGTPYQISVPAHVELAKKLIAEGKDIYIGDQIQYIVKTKTPKIEAITIEDYNKGADFDREYYWERIVQPILKVLFVTHPKFVLDNYTLWAIKELTAKQAQSLFKKLKKEIEKDEE